MCRQILSICFLRLKQTDYPGSSSYPRLLWEYVLGTMSFWIVSTNRVPSWLNIWWETPAASSCRAPVSCQAHGSCRAPGSCRTPGSCRAPGSCYSIKKIVRIRAIAQKNRIDSLIINLVRKWKNIEIFLCG